MAGRKRLVQSAIPTTLKWKKKKMKGKGKNGKLIYPFRQTSKIHLSEKLVKMWKSSIIYLSDSFQNVFFVYFFEENKKLNVENSKKRKKKNWNKFSINLVWKLNCSIKKGVGKKIYFFCWQIQKRNFLLWFFYSSLFYMLSLGSEVRWEDED